MKFKLSGFILWILWMSAVNFMVIWYYSLDQIVFCLTWLKNPSKPWLICHLICLPTQVFFNITIGLLSCPEDGKDEDVTVLVRPVGYNESTVIRIHSKCPCDCGPTKRCYDDNQSQCSQQDNPGQERRPDHELIKNSNGDSNSKCRPDGSDIDCSGRGVCDCGRCVCEQSRLGAVYGKYCEKDDFSCSYKGGLVCGGEGVTPQKSSNKSTNM